MSWQHNVSLISKSATHRGSLSLFFLLQIPLFDFLLEQINANYYLVLSTQAQHGSFLQDFSKWHKSRKERRNIFIAKFYLYKSSCRNQIGFSYLEKLPDLLESERRLREIAQREIALTADTEQKPGQKQVESDIIKELETLKAEYFITDIKRQRLSTNFVHAPLRRGFELWRSHPLWYLHKILSEDCVTRNKQNKLRKIL